MRYYKYVANGYIEAIGTGLGGIEIAAEEYRNIMFVITNKPPATKTTDYRLKEDLSWESYIIDKEDEDSEESNNEDKAEAYNILIGGE